MSERRTALVTGASSGLGMELAQYAEERFGVEATVLPKDLAHPGAAGEIADGVAARGIGVDVLVNSAGFTQLVPFTESDEAVMLALLRVNMEATTQLTRRLLPGMVARGRGRVVNLASNAAFQPGPGMACYYASKAHVLNFSIALHEEIRGSGVTVTALCPGPTASGFQARAAMEDARLVKGKRLPSAAEVAEWGWAKALKGVPFAVHGIRWRSFAFGTRFLPRPLAARIAAGANGRI